MTDPAKRERAALVVLDLLPDRWALGPRRTTPEPGAGRTPLVDELAAMIDLRNRLDERRRPDQLAEIDRRGRSAFLEGAEERSRTVEGRPLTAYKLKRVTKRDPGD